MKPIWQLDGNDVIGLQGDSPGFVRVVNALLAMQGQNSRVLDANVRLNVKDTEPDGGVDAAIDQLVPDDPTGFLGVPTCWQYKAQPKGNLKPKDKGGQEAALREEIRKPYAVQLIKAGYGYRFCIADDMPAEKKSEWEGWLTDEAKQIDPQAQPAKVITATDLALWATRFPAIVGGQFRPYLHALLSLHDWHRQFTALTPTFVPSAAWTATAETVRRHVDFSQPIGTTLAVQGEAGVGKSRNVCEALLGDAARNALVAATSDERTALEFAQFVAKEKRVQAILVADECSLEYRVKIDRVAEACSDRLRVIAIDNSLQRESGAGEIGLKHLESTEVEAVLEKNFPTLPSDRRRAYSTLAQGFVRLAVDLCRHDHLVPPDGNIGSVFGFFQDSYLVQRLSPEQFAAVQLVSLLPRVGFRDDVKSELQALCALPQVKLDLANVVQAAQKLQQAPGFIAFAGRYLYVTPTLIAQVAFQGAWNQWIAPDADSFLIELPEALIEPFMERIQSAGTSDMRDRVANFFLNWAMKLAPPDLGIEKTVRRFARLVEVQPDIFLSLLRGLLERTPLDQIRRLHSSYPEGENSRRQLVWLAEKLAHFSETFADAEVVLLRLALAESEPHLGNNASQLWAALFRIVLSGTPISFAQRLVLLEERLRTADTTQLPLALAALDEILADGPVSRLAVPPIVFGRIPPPQWRPATQSERQECRRAALEMASTLTGGAGSVADGVRAVVVRRLAPLLLAGHLDEVRTIIGSPPLPDALLATVARALEDFLDVFCREHEITVHRPVESNDNTVENGREPQTALRRFAKAVSDELESRIRDWYRSLIPNDLHSRLIGVVGQEFWHQQLNGDSETWNRALAALAEELLQSPTELDRELNWLSSPAAQSAFRFGQELAQTDAKGILLERMLSDIPQAGGTGLARGYIERIATAHPEFLPRVNECLDRLQTEAPKVAFELIWSAGEEIRKVARLFEMIDAGGLAAESLRALAYSVRNLQLTDNEFLGALTRLVRAAESGNEQAAATAIHLLSVWLRPKRQAPGVEKLQASEQVRAVLLRVLELTLAGEAIERNVWMELAEDLAVVEPIAAIRLVARALGGSDYNTRSLAGGSLASLAKDHPQAVIEAVGEVALNPTSGWLFQVGDFSNILRSLPDEVVLNWLERVGVPGARVIARHLLPPSLNEKGEPEIPTLTQLILSRYEEDEEVFRGFLAGTHTGQVYSGDIATAHEQEAAVARRFLGHPIKRVREWAAYEIQSATSIAKYRRQRDEEATAP